MGHFKWNLKGEFHEASVSTIFIPRGLEDHLFDPIFFDGIDVLLAGRHQSLKFTSRWVVVTIQHIRPDEFITAVLFKGFGGFVVHFENDAFFITDGDGGGKFFDPGVFVHGTPEKTVDSD